MTNRITERETNVVAIVKGDERYLFMFRDEHMDQAVRACGRWASDDDLSFTWYDAAVACQKMRQAKQ